MNKTPTLEQVIELKKVFGELYDENFRPKNKTIFDKKINELNNNLYQYFSKDTSLKEIELTLEKWYENYTQTPEYVSNTTLTPEQLKDLGAEADKRNRDIKQTQDNARLEVERARKRTEELIKNRKVVVVPTEALPTITLSDKEKETLLAFSKTAKEDPATLEKYIEEKINESITLATDEYKENITPEIITKTATSITENLVTLPDFENISEIPTIIPVMNPASPFVGINLTEDETKEEVYEVSQALAFGLDAEAAVNFSGTKAVFGENIASTFYGPADGHITRFEIAKEQDRQKDEGIQFNVSDVYHNGTKFYDYFQKIKSARSVQEVTSTAMTYIPSYTPATYVGTASKTLSTLTKALPYVGAYSSIRTSVIAGQWIRNGNLALNSPNIAGLIGNGGSRQMIILSSPIVSSRPFMFMSKGGNFAVAVGTEKTVAGNTIFRAGIKIGQSSIATVTTTAGTQVATATGFFAKALTFIGGLSGWMTAGIGFVVGYVAGKILEKVNWAKVKKIFGEYILPVAVGGGIFLMGAPLAGIAVGGFLFGVARGLTFAGIGAGIYGFAGMIGGAMVTSIAMPVIIALIATPVLVAFIMLVINNSSYMVPPSVSTLSNVVSPYIEVIKNPVPAGPFQNSELPLTVEYKITIRAKKSTLTNVRISYECDVTKKGTTIPCPSVTPTIPTSVDSISPITAYTFSYKQEYIAGKFEDTLVSDTISVTADVPEEANVKSSGSAGIKIGNPPDTCPSIWPVNGSFSITQTSGGGYSHKLIEAMDIATNNGVTVLATHTGKAKVVYTTGAYRPLYIDVTSNCAGRNITTRYAHLSGAFVTDGQQVNLNQPIGASGSDGTGPHLHYEFIGEIQMYPPYIPKNVVRNCAGNCGALP